jgi:hypothetical protein
LFARVTIASRRCHKFQSQGCLLVDTQYGFALTQASEKTETQWPKRMRVRHQTGNLSGCHSPALLPRCSEQRRFPSADATRKVKSSLSRTTSKPERNVAPHVTKTLMNSHGDCLTGPAITHGMCVALGALGHYVASRPPRESLFVVMTLFATSLIPGVVGVTTYENADYWSLSPAHPNRPVPSATTASSLA